MRSVVYITLYITLYDKIQAELHVGSLSAHQMVCMSNVQRTHTHTQISAGTAIQEVHWRENARIVRVHRARILHNAVYAVQRSLMQETACKT